MRLTLLFLLFCQTCFGAAQQLIDFEGGTNGQAVNLSSLTNSLHGPVGTFYIGAGVGTNSYFSAVAQRSFIGSVTIPGYGAYTGSGTLGLSSLLTNLNYIKFTPTNASSSASMGFWFMTDMAVDSNYNVDLGTIFGTDAGEYNNFLILADNGNLRCVLEKLHVGDSTNWATIQPNQWYWITIGYGINGVTNGFRVYDTNLTLIGVVELNNYSNTVPAGFVYIGSEFTGNIDLGTHFYYDNMLLDFSGAPAWPLLPRSPATSIIPAERRTDWTIAGVPGGIPWRTNIFVNVLTTTNLAYKCYPSLNPPNDDSTNIQNAIVACPSNQVVYLPAGTYTVSNSIRAGWKGFFSVRGDGPGKTIIRSGPNISGGTFDFEAEYWTTNNVLTVSGTYPPGSSNINVLSVNGNTLAVGNMLWIDQTNDNYLVSPVGYDGGNQAAFCDFGQVLSSYIVPGSRLMQHIAFITAFSGTNLTFWPPLNYTFSDQLAAHVNWNVASGSGIGMENFTIANDANYTNAAQTMITINDACGSWITNVEFSYIWVWGALMLRTANCQIENCYFHDSMMQTVGRGYATEFHQCSGLLFQNNILAGQSQPITVCAGDDGCVFAYNFFTNTFISIQTNLLDTDLLADHGAHPMMNLYEGNVASELQADHDHGSSSHQTFLRNFFRGTDLGVAVNQKPISLDSGSLSNNLVGNVLGTSSITWVYAETNSDFTEPVIYRLGYPYIGNNSFVGLDGSVGVNCPLGSTTNDVWILLDPRVKDSLLRAGNYDYATGGTNWDSGIAVQTIPNSLYLSGKPSWWDSSPWPPIGPDLTPMVGTIPAQLRYRGLKRGLSASSDRPSPPPGLHVAIGGG